MPEETVAYVDVDLEDLIPEYMQNRREDIENILHLIDQGELDEVRRLGHSMKGSGGGYGFPPITEIGGELEQAALEGNVKLIVEASEKLTHYLNTVKIVWQEDVL